MANDSFLYSHIWHLILFILAVVKHIHQRERAHGDQARDKFKILSMKIPQGLEYSPEIVCPLLHVFSYCMLFC